MKHTANIPLWDAILDQIIAAFPADDPVRRGMPVPDEMIQAIEQKLAVTFPPDYREFLRTYGYLWIRGTVFGGIWTSAPWGVGEGSVLGDTLRMREGGMPHRFIAVRPMVYDQCLCLDTEVSEGPRLWFYDLEALHPCEYADGFAEHLTDYLRLSLQEP